MQTELAHQAVGRPRPWNKGKLVSAKPAFKLREIWAIRVRLQIAGGIRDLALFCLAIDRKLCGCDLVNIRVGDVAQGNHAVVRAVRGTVAHLPEEPTFSAPSFGGMPL